MATRKTRQKRKTKKRETKERYGNEIRKRREKAEKILGKQNEVRKKLLKIIEPEKIMPSQRLDEADWYDKMYSVCIILAILLFLSILISAMS